LRNQFKEFHQTVRLHFGLFARQPLVERTLPGFDEVIDFLRRDFHARFKS